MALVSVDVSEILELGRDLQRHADEFEPQVQLLTEKTAHDGVAVSQQIVPVDTGHLKGSIGVDVGHLWFVLGPTAEYGGYVETGTSEMAPEPYIGPAYDQVTDGFMRAAGVLVGRAMS